MRMRFGASNASGSVSAAQRAHRTVSGSRIPRLIFRRSRRLGCSFSLAAAFEAESAVCWEVVAAGAGAALTDGRGLITGATFSGGFDVPLSAAACGATGALGMATAAAGGDAVVSGEAAPDPPLACDGVAAPSAAATAVTGPDGVGTSKRMPATPPAASTTSPATARYGRAPTLRAAGAGRRSSADTVGDITDFGLVLRAGRQARRTADRGATERQRRIRRIQPRLGTLRPRLPRPQDGKVIGYSPAHCRLALLGARSIGSGIDTAILGPQ